MPPRIISNAIYATEAPPQEFDSGAATGDFGCMLHLLPSGPSGAWLLIALKALGALGFMTAANLVILYAC